MLKHIDILGNEIKIMVNKEDKFKSSVGSFFTCLLVLMSTLAFVAFGRDIFEHQAPIVSLDRELNINPLYNFNANSTYVFTVYDGVLHVPIPNLEKLFRMYVILQDIDPARAANGTTTLQTFYDLEKCTPDRLNAAIQENLILTFDNYYCFPSNLTLALVGTWNIGKSKVFKLNVDYCLNSTSNNNSCFSIPEIQKRLPSTFNYNWITFDTYFVSNDTSNPGKYISNAGATRSNINTMTRLVYWFKNIDYFTDVGWILQDTHYQNYTGLDHIESQVFPVEGTTTFFSHIFSLIQLKDIYNRQYIKIQGVLAYIGGFISFFYATFGFISKFINRGELLEVFRTSYSNEIKRSHSEIYNNFNNNNYNKEEKSISNSIVISNFAHTDKKIEFSKPEKILPKSNLEFSTLQKVNLSIFESVLILCPCTKAIRDKADSLSKLNFLYKSTISIENFCSLFNKIKQIELLLNINKEKKDSIPFISKDQPIHAESSNLNLVFDRRLM